MDDPGRLNTRDSETEKLILERLKLEVDALKHISTLATGTIVIIATFLDKLPKPLEQPLNLVIAVGAMLTCLLFAFVMLFRKTFFMSGGVKVGFGPFRFRGRELPNLDRVFLITIYASFGVGMVQLTSFIIANVKHYAAVSAH